MKNLMLRRRDVRISLRIMEALPLSRLQELLAYVKCDVTQEAKLRSILEAKATSQNKA